MNRRALGALLRRELVLCMTEHRPSDNLLDDEETEK